MTDLAIRDLRLHQKGEKNGVYPEKKPPIVQWNIF